MTAHDPGRAGRLRRFRASRGLGVGDGGLLHPTDIFDSIGVAVGVDGRGFHREGEAVDHASEARASR